MYRLKDLQFLLINFRVNIRQLQFYKTLYVVYYQIDVMIQKLKIFGVLLSSTK